MRRQALTPSAKAARNAYMKKYMREYRRRRAAEDPEYRTAQTAASRRRRERRRHEAELELGLLGDAAFEQPLSSDD